MFQNAVTVVLFPYTFLMYRRPSQHGIPDGTHTTSVPYPKLECEDMTMTSNRLLPGSNQATKNSLLWKHGPTLIALAVLLSGAAALRIHAAINHFI
jgi:hypothetical protein